MGRQQKNNEGSLSRHRGSHFRLPPAAPLHCLIVLPLAPSLLPRCSLHRPSARLHCCCSNSMWVIAVTYKHGEKSKGTIANTRHRQFFLAIIMSLRRCLAASYISHRDRCLLWLCHALAGTAHRSRCRWWQELAGTRSRPIESFCDNSLWLRNLMVLWAYVQKMSGRWVCLSVGWKLTSSIGLAENRLRFSLVRNYWRAAVIDDRIFQPYIFCIANVLIAVLDQQWRKQWRIRTQQPRRGHYGDQGYVPVAQI